MVKNNVKDRSNEAFDGNYELFLITGDCSGLDDNVLHQVPVTLEAVCKCHRDHRPRTDPVNPRLVYGGIGLEGFRKNGQRFLVAKYKFHPDDPETAGSEIGIECFTELTGAQFCCVRDLLLSLIHI